MCFKPPQPLKKFDLQKFFKSLSAGLTNQPYMAYSTRDNPLITSKEEYVGRIAIVNTSHIKDFNIPATL